MGMLNHKSNSLTNDKRVQVEQQQTRSNIIKESTDKEANSFNSVTFPRNLRADNHIANKVQAMVNIGYAADAKSVLDSLINDKVSSMPKREQERINQVVKMLEIKDYFSQQSKQL